MTFREAELRDIKGLMDVRMSVKENMLNTPALVTDEICADYLTGRGKGWLCETDNRVVGFAIADLVDNSIWALFVRPEYEGKGIGKALQTIMLNWYFKQGKQSVWLTTALNTRAEKFYRMTGWKETGYTKTGEIRFEMNVTDWIK